MHQEKYIFAQLVSFLDNFKFKRIVQKYDGDKYVKSFTCWNQLLEMMFAQLIDKSIYDMLKKQDINLTHKILLTELLDKSKINNLKIRLVQVNQICLTFNYVQLFSGH